MQRRRQQASPRDWIARRPGAPAPWGVRSTWAAAAAAACTPSNSPAGGGRRWASTTCQPRSRRQRPTVRAQPGWAALQQALAQWRAGTADAVGYDLPLAAARSSYAHLAGVDPSAVAVGSQVSVFAGLIAANLPDGSEVLTATGDFTSILFPFYAQSGRGIRVREVPLDRIAECVTSRTTLVAVSAVQSADGRVADLDALHAASRATGARVLLDTTQAVGWLPVNASRFAYTACGGYKWLLSPRGTAYFTINPALIDDLTPHHAGWYAGDDPWSSIYGGPLGIRLGAGRSDCCLSQEDEL
jgi:kynureninase